MRCFNRRRAFSMLEMLLSISVSAVLMMISAAWIHQTLTFSSSIRQQQSQHLNCQKISWQLRDDVRHCKAMVIVDNQLQLTQKDGSMIRYIASPALLLVESSQGDQLVRTERFVFEPGAKVRWDTSEMPTWISLVVERGKRVRSTPDSEPTSSEAERTTIGPIELHVRVRADRWKMATKTVSRSTLVEKEDD